MFSGAVTVMPSYLRLRIIFVTAATHSLQQRIVVGLSDAGGKALTARVAGGWVASISHGGLARAGTWGMGASSWVLGLGRVGLAGWVVAWYYLVEGRSAPKHTI